MALEVGTKANGNVHAIYILCSLARMRASQASSSSAIYTASIVSQSPETKNLKELVPKFLDPSLKLSSLAKLPVFSLTDLSPATCAPSLLSTFDYHSTMSKNSVAGSSSHEEVIEAVLRLPSNTWAEEGRKAVEKEKTSRGKQSSEKLAEKAFDAFDAASKKRAEIASTLRKQADIDPETAAVEFSLFRVFQMAKYFKKNPHNLERLKTEAESNTFNEGYKLAHELFDEIARAADEIIAGGSLAMEMDDREKMFGECSLREILVTMEWYVENHREKICALYPEYATIPRMVDVQEFDQNGRPVRERKPKKME